MAATAAAEGASPRVTQDEVEAAGREALQASRAGAALDRVEKLVERYRLKRLLFDRWLVRQPTAEGFLHFYRLVRPELVIGRHIRCIAREVEDLLAGRTLRLAVSLPPGHTKSETISIVLPSWLFGIRPNKRVLHTSHSKPLVEDFGRGIRDVIRSPAFARLFPEVSVRRDSNATIRWDTTAGGKYRGGGVQGKIAGKRGEFGIIDDPISEQEAYSDLGREKFQKWYPGGFRSRMMAWAPIILVATRWHSDDPVGWLLRQAEKDAVADQWKVLNLPAILDEEAAAALGDGAKAGEALFEELWPLDYMLATKASMPPYQWSALYMGRPIDEAGNIFRMEWWKPWPADKKPPVCESVIQTWDTAFEEHEAADYSACTTWGVFADEETGRRHVLLLGRWRGRVGFPELREQVARQAHKHKPDIVLVEPKASGKSVIQEFRRPYTIKVPDQVGVPIDVVVDVPVREWVLDRRKVPPKASKVARAHAASIVLFSGSVWYPADKRWALEVIEECAAFPRGAHDDLVDTAAMAWLWLRSAWDIDVDADPEDEPPDPGEPQTQGGLYG